MRLISRIPAIDNAEILIAIKTTLDCTKNKPFVYPNEVEADELMMASDEGKNGLFTIQFVMDKKVKEWSSPENWTY